MGATKGPRGRKWLLRSSNLRRWKLWLWVWPWYVLILHESLSHSAETIHRTEMRDLLPAGVLQWTHTIVREQFLKCGQESYEVRDSTVRFVPAVQCQASSRKSVHTCHVDGCIDGMFQQSCGQVHSSCLIYAYWRKRCINYLCIYQHCYARHIASVQHMCTLSKSVDKSANESGLSVSSQHPLNNIYLEFVPPSLRVINTF